MFREAAVGGLSGLGQAGSVWDVTIFDYPIIIFGLSLDSVLVMA